MNTPAIMVGGPADGEMVVLRGNPGWHVYQGLPDPPTIGELGADMIPPLRIVTHQYRRADRVSEGCVVFEYEGAT